MVAVLASSGPLAITAANQTSLNQGQTAGIPLSVSTPAPSGTLEHAVSTQRIPNSTNSPSVTSTIIPITGQNNSGTGGPDLQPTFPIRAAFYYPWYPEAWKQHGFYPYTNYNPALGIYSSTDQNTLKQHIAMMQYAHIDAGIASWWGQGSQTDTKIEGLLTAATGTDFRWALYYEAEGQGDPTVNQIHDDLVYIHDHYGQEPTYLRVNGKFVIFVYSQGNERCEMADRWKQANTVGAYIVLRVFPGYARCASQPDSWHQYSPALAEFHTKDFSYTISPGFWLKGNDVRLERDITRWIQNVRDMVASGAKWQLISTFNEWGEGTAVEPATEWASPTVYGLYLDALHSNGGKSSP